MHINQPSRKTLFTAWLAMMAFSLGTMLAGRVTDTSSLGPIFVLALFIITMLKATWILRYFLNLRASTKAWNSAFSAFLFILLAIIFAIYLFGWINQGV